MLNPYPSLSQLSQAVRFGETPSESLVSASFKRLHSVNPRLNAFISFDEPRALRHARNLDANCGSMSHSASPLAGIPIAIKDNMCTPFGVTTCGSKILQNFRAPYAATVVERLENAGAVIIGKTNLDEFAMGSSTENSAFFTTKNPWNTDFVAGGSSGGSTAAVAARIVHVALGSDTGGSIREPASFCGVVGLKPTYGRVSRYGLVAFGSSLDQIGPIALTAADAALVLNVIAGHDPRDSTSAEVSVPDYVAELERPIQGLRIGMSEEYFGPGLSPQVESSVRSAISTLEAQGAKVHPIHLPHMKYGIACYYLIAMAEASSNLARFDGVRYGHRTAHPEDIIDLYSASRAEGFGPEVKRRIMLGAFALSSGYYDAYYLKALKVRTLIKRDFERAFHTVDVIASPVAPTTAFRVGEKSQDPMAMYLSDIYTIAANLAGIPAISIPCGFDKQELPIGFQLMGNLFTEARLLNVAHQYQKCTEWHMHTPPMTP